MSHGANVYIKDLTAVGMNHGRLCGGTMKILVRSSFPEDGGREVQAW
jgi:hypothetical protein